MGVWVGVCVCGRGEGVRVHVCIVYTERALRQQQFHVVPAM